MKTISILGSTGSIGTQALEVAAKHNIKVKALAANSDVEKLAAQAKELLPECVCIYREDKKAELEKLLAGTGIKILTGMEGLKEIARMDGVDIMLNSVVGMVGLVPTLTAIEKGTDIALANKETLVCAGELVMEQAKKYGAEIIPVDSEHSAIFQCLMGNHDKSQIRRLLLTCSGGPFYGMDRAQLSGMKKEDALRHPNWKMGPKITIDCATLMNKGLELIEAVWLFGVTPEKVEVNVHRQSILHSAVEFEDGSVIGQMGVPDMRIPIQFALTYPERLPSPAKRLSLFDVGTMTFEKVDEETFLCLKYAKKMIARGGTACTVLDSANEAAVGLFLEDKIPFYRIGELVADACENVREHKEVTLGNILDSENTAREYVIAHA